MERWALCLLLLHPDLSQAPLASINPAYLEESLQKHANPKVAAVAHAVPETTRVGAWERTAPLHAAFWKSDIPGSLFLPEH